MSQTPVKDCLPHGWVVKTSAKYPERIYYFNTISGCSTWECPELVPSPVSNEKQWSASKPALNTSLHNETKDDEKKPAVCIISSPGVSPLNTKLSNSNLQQDKSKKCPHLEQMKQPNSDTCFPSRKIRTRRQKVPCQNPPKAASTRPAKRSLETEALPVLKEDSFKIPMAIVTPVTLGEAEKANREKPSLSKSQRKKANRKAREKAALELSAKQHPSPFLTNSKPQSSGGSQPVNAYKKLRTSEPTFVNKADRPSISALPDKSVSSFNDLSTEESSSDLYSYHIVLDTNILMHDCIHISEILETPFEGCGPPHMFVPWIVVSELDKLKNYKDATGKAAAKAIGFIHKKLKSKHPRFHGQSAIDAKNCKKLEFHNCNDDRILEFCLNLRTKTLPEKVILMTNDVNLSNKAMIYKIPAHNITSLLKDIKPDVILQTSFNKKKDKKNSNGISNDHQKLVNECNGYKKEIANIMTEARQMLKNVLDPFLVEEMNQDYGDTWEHFEIDRRLLRGILAAYIKYWHTVFYKSFNKKLKNNFELLYQKAIRNEGFYGTLEDCLMILHSIEDIFHAIKNVRANAPIPIEDIQSMKQSCTHIFTLYNQLDSSLSNEKDAKKTKESHAFDLLNHNWRIINELCGMIMDFYKIQHNFEYPKPESIPPESEYRRVVADLYPSLLQLKQLMKKTLDQVKSSTTVFTTFKHLADALRNLVPSLNIKYVMPDMSQFTSKGLQEFCQNPENRQRLELGYKQLETFCSKVKEAIDKMISDIKNSSMTE